MSIFVETMKKTISIYRQMLRKHLPQAARINKLTELNLKNDQLYKNDVALYHTGYAIITDIEKNMALATHGYYTYSGVANFALHLKNFLSNYVVEGNQVIHCSQKASRALVQAIQLLGLPREKLGDDIAAQLAKCNKIIAHFGSPEQRELHRNALQTTIRKYQDENTTFYRTILNNFHQRIQEVDSRT